VKILVTVKRVEDPEMKIRVKPDGSGIVTDGLNYVVNPFDEIAVEQALQIKEAQGGEVVVVSIGDQGWVQQMRAALAMGADRGVLVEVDDPAVVDSYLAAVLIQKVVEKEQPDLIITGKQAVDRDSNQMSQILAELMGVGQACFAYKVEVADGKAQVVREVDGGLETKEVDLPAVITADLRLNEPRYASLPNIMKAKRKKIDTYAAADLGVALTPRVVIESMAPPPQREGGVSVPDVATLVDKLQNEAKVL
jgi:electron transfer flavoprotein beta subunit